MKEFRFTDGCTATSIEVDGNNFSDMENENKIEAMKTLIEYVFKQENNKDRDYLLRDMFEMLFTEICTSVNYIKYDKENRPDSEIGVFCYKDNEDYLLMFDCQYGSDVVIILNEDTWQYVEDKEKERIFIKLISKNPNNCYLNNCFMEILRLYGNYEYLYHCDQCGDSVSEYVLKV